MRWRLNGESFVFNIYEYDDIQNVSAILMNLTDNGLGINNGATVEIPIPGIYQLTKGQRALLDLPLDYPFYIKIDTDGIINHSGFKYEIKFFQSKDHGRLRISKVTPPIIYLLSQYGETYSFLLTEKQYNVYTQINNCNSKSFVDSGTNYRNLALLKQIASGDASIFFTDTLEQYEVVSLKQVKLHLQNDDTGLSLLPEIPDDVRAQSDLSEGLFNDRFMARSRVLPVYTIPSENGSEYKVIVPEKSIEVLSTIKEKYNYVNDQQKIREIIDNPQNIFDEDLFELSEFFSDRVIEIGLYKPKFYAFISPYKSEWIPGFVIEDKYNGNTNIFLKTEEEVRDFEKAIELAESNDSNEISYHGYKLDRKEAKDILNLAKRQNANPKIKAELSSCSKKVLIIEENAESLGYKVNCLDTNTPDLYTFHKIDNLTEGISLKEHQCTGVAWLQYLYLNKNKGCLLADDMGLGKTLQVLYFLQWHKRYHNNKKPYLIVAPVSLLDNWSAEIKKFFTDDSLKPVIVHGDIISKRMNDDDIQWLNSRSVILTNYETVRSCQFNICAVDYAVVILDEAQKIKTPGTYVTCAVKALKSDFKIAMTGTPVENTFLDLWCIMDFAIPGLLGNAKEFASLYQNPLKKGDTDVKQLGIDLRNRMGIFFMRRCKADVLKDLPSKTELKENVLMTQVQEEKYRNTIIESQKALKLENDKGILELIYRLRRISESPLIADEENNIETVSINEIIDSSAKIQSTISILTQIRNKGEKAIIFCVYKDSQRMLQRVVCDRFGLTPKIINGDTKVLSDKGRNIENNYSRQQAIDDFADKVGFNVIIMSPIAAGMGLNVTAANHVIHFGRHWNPAKESQATDRAYRIGQKKPVFVYYPITILSDSNNFKSFDQTLDRLLMNKSSLADATLFPTEQTEVRIADFKEMLSMAGAV